MVCPVASLWQAPLIDLVGECGETKTTKNNKTKNEPWRWESIHQQPFDNVKATIAKELILAYPDFTKPFKIYKPRGALPRRHLCTFRILIPYYFAPYIMPLCHSAILPFCHSAIPPFHHSAILPFHSNTQ